MNMLSSLNLLASADLPSVAPRPGSFWLPTQASTGAAQTDLVFYFIYWVSVFFFILIVALMVYFVIRYRRRREGELPANQVTHNTTLEITWSAIPLVLVVIMFYLGFRGFIDLARPPRDSLDIRVEASKWAWWFNYPNGHGDNELHVPVDQPVRLTLESRDVIHSLYIPAFRIKKDAVPGRYNSVWFEAKAPGDYLLLCAEYCGTQHSDMYAKVVVHEPGKYEQWLENASDPFKTRTMAEVGELLYLKRCAGCHSIDGTANVGPSFKDIYGETAQFDDGSTATIEDNYIRESILYPQRKIVRGYGKDMPSFKGQLSDREITAIIEYIKQLSAHESGDADSLAAGTQESS
jgi:cytochrome c oxidase subunit 2